MTKVDSSKHPMRDISISVYERVQGSTGPMFIAKYEPFKLHPIFFVGNSKEETEQSARQFADDAVEKYEATYLKRVEGLAKARLARGKSK
ncbi:hypothetical protein UFOVP59_44 [uncultured Caudovirales phage]|uniref:Uncharacterized protein n=1 Tax=uncultured Caudovirales phage TaxID=2100421 RepID=A0A6J7WWE0_9CAUD|nr:hypothetical protein UFOVP59_44 [uncultured Caudovirales phage]CAB5221022.1 hypothetical protein UFOVP246_71 [uncultured Caudovirales phage]